MVQGKDKFELLIAKFLDEIGTHGSFSLPKHLADVERSRKSHIEDCLKGIEGRIKEVVEIVSLWEDDCESIGRPDMSRMICNSSILIEQAVKKYAFMHAEKDIGLNQEALDLVWHEIERCFNLPQYRCNLRSPILWLSMESDVLLLQGIDKTSKIQFRRPTLVDEYYLHKWSNIQLQREEYSVLAEITRESVHESKFIDKDGGIQAIDDDAKALEYLASCLRIFTAMKPHMRATVIEWEHTERNRGHTAFVPEPKPIDWRDMQYVWDIPKEDVCSAHLTRSQMREFPGFWNRFKKLLNKEDFQYVIDQYNDGLKASGPNSRFRHTFESLQKLIPYSLSKVKLRTTALLCEFAPTENRKTMYNFMDVVIDCRNSALHGSPDPFTSKPMKKLKRYFPNRGINDDVEKWKSWFTYRLIEITRQSIRYAILSEEYSKKEEWDEILDRAVAYGERPVPSPPEWTKDGEPRI